MSGGQKQENNFAFDTKFSDNPCIFMHFQKIYFVAENITGMWFSPQISWKTFHFDRFSRNFAKSMLFLKFVWKNTFPWFFRHQNRFFGKFRKMQWLSENFVSIKFFFPCFWAPDIQDFGVPNVWYIATHHYINVWYIFQSSLKVLW